MLRGNKMANTRNRIREWIDTLLKEGLYLMRELKKKDNSKFRAGYQTWYTRVLPLVRQLLPERLEEFTNLYDDKRTPHDIAGYLLDVDPATYLISYAHMSFIQQYRIFESAQTRLDDILANIQGLVQAEILDSELDAATELWKAGHIRSAGTLAGVVLERHLAKVCSSRNLESQKKKPTLADWNEILKEAKVYDVPTWRSIQAFTDIRNLCAHLGDREPTREEVDELIRGVEGITLTIF